MIAIAICELLKRTDRRYAAGDTGTNMKHRSCLNVIEIATTRVITIRIKDTQNSRADFKVEENLYQLSRELTTKNTLAGPILMLAACNRRQSMKSGSI